MPRYPCGRVGTPCKESLGETFSNGNGSFCLASRPASELMKMSHIQANRRFLLLVADGILTEVERGGMPDRQRDATRFRYVGN